MKKILVLNSGSTTVKYQLFNMEGQKHQVIAKGMAERIGISGSRVSMSIEENEKLVNILIDKTTNKIYIESG